MKQGWEIKKIRDICDKASSNIAQNKITELDGDFPVYGASGYVQNIDFFHRDSPYIGIVKDGAGVGRVNIYPAYSSLLGTLQYILPKDGYLLEYVAYALKSLDLASFASGATIPHIYFKNYGEIEIPVAPLTEQKKIVEELDCLSGIIEKKKQQLKEYDALAQSIFYEMFGNPIDNEKGWEVKKLEELCDIINGFAFPSSDFAECNPIKVIKITNVGVNEFISDDSSLPEEYNNMEGCKVHTGDIVIALTRTIISTGVKRAIVPNEYNESLVNQRVAAILANNRIVSRRFIYSFLGTDFVRQYILQKATALMQPNLSIRDLRDMPTIYPPLILQQEFASKIEAIEKQKELIKQSITETEELFNSRMDYYFN